MTTLPPSPRTETEADARPPRPGWAKGLGVSHIVVATLSSLMLILSMFYSIIIEATRTPTGTPTFMTGMHSARLTWFVMIDGISGLIANGFTFASGVALINLRSWGARVWRWLGPVKVGRLVAVWGSFIVFVAPVLAASTGQFMAMLIKQQAGPKQNSVPTAGEMTLVYAWAFLAMGIGMIVLGSIYPAIAWWIARRPAVRLALVEGDVGLPSRSVEEEHQS